LSGWREGKDNPVVTVVMVTRNRCAEAQRTVERLRALPERPEIVAVDNGSSDGTARALQASGDPHVSVVPLECDIGAGARNVGVRRASTRYVALCDDDSWWAAGSLAAAVELLDAHPQVGLIAARVHVGAAERLDATCAAMRESPLEGNRSQPGKPVLGFLACASVMRRDAFLSVGGFRSELGIGGEEQLLAVDLVAAGWQLAYVDELLVHHYPSPRRNGRTREVVLARNALWFSWLRRPLRNVLTHTLSALVQATTDGTKRAALAQAVRGLPWVLRDRHLLPRGVEQDLRRLEHAETLRSATWRRLHAAAQARDARAGRSPLRTG
jgi:N-acetylglucosaminyl-diphospho-decaprenol L-rhamnosyltransferase